MPKQEAFETNHVVESTMLNEGQRFPVFDRVEYPAEGGILRYYKGMPYPAKGFPFPSAVWSNDVMKRITLAAFKITAGKEMVLALAGIALLPWKLKMRALSRVLEQYGRIGQWLLNGSFLAEKMYCPTAQAARIMVFRFLQELGMSSDICEKVPKIVATILEYDDSYRYRVQDIMSETSATALQERPGREIKRLLNILQSREKSHAIGSFKAIGAVISVAMWHPKIRAAFRKAVWPKEIRQMILDNGDRYHVLLRGDYDYQGLTFEERVDLYEDVHRVSACCHAKVSQEKEVIITFHDKRTFGYECSKCGKACETGYLFPPEVTIAPPQA